MLKKVIGLRTIVSSGAGLALATVAYINTIEVAHFVAGNSAWLAILVAGIMCCLSAFCFGELNSMFPSAAGIKLFIQKAFNEKIALSFATFYIIISISIVGSETYILGNVLTAGFPAVPPYIWGLLFIAIVMFLNYRGIKLAGMTQDITTYSMFFFLIIISVYAVSKNISTLVTPFNPGSIEGFLQAMAIGVYLYVGFEWVCPLVEEVTDYKMITKGMLLTIGLLFITYALLTTAMTSELPTEILQKSNIPHVLFAEHLFGPTGKYIMLIMSLVASLTTFNAGIMTTSRFLYAMSRDHALPRFISTLHEKYFTPYISIFILGAIAALLSAFVFITHQYLVFLYLSAAMESIIYIVIALSVIMIRIKFPEQERPFKIPGGYIIPIIVIIFYGILTIFLFSDTSVRFSSPFEVNFGLFKFSFWNESQVSFVLLIVGFLCTVWYSYYAVPRLRAKHEAERAKKKSRRKKSGE